MFPNTEDLRLRLLGIAESNDLRDSVRKLNNLETKTSTSSVVLAGAFGRGKTTLLNALLQASLLPTQNSPVDSYVTSVRSGSPDSLTVYFSSGHPRTTSPNSIELAQILQGNRKVERIEIVSDVQFLPRQQVLNEVPGLGEINPNHATFIKSAVASAQYVVFVVDIVLEVAEEELEFLRTLPSSISKLLIVANKIDLSDNPTEAFQHWMTLINSLRLSASIEYFKVSAQNALVGNFSGDWNGLVEQMAQLLPVGMNNLHLDNSTLGKIAQSIRDELLTLRSEKTSAAHVEDLAETRHLVLNVIRDQATDIKQTIRESLEATVYKLETDLRRHARSEQDVAFELQNWADRERTRTQTRLERHVQSVIDDVKHSTGKIFELKVAVPPITVGKVMPFGGDAHKMPDTNVRRLQAIGAGAIAAATSFFFTGWTPVGWFISIGVGTATAVTAWVLTERVTSVSGRPTELPNLQSVLLPMFTEAVDSTVEQLRRIVEEAFGTGTNESSAPINSYIAEVDTILALLKSE